MSKHEFADDKYGKGKMFTLDDYTRDQQFKDRTDTKYPRFFLQYTSRLLSVCQEMLEELGRRVSERSLSPNDYHVLDRLKQVYDTHVTDDHNRWIRDTLKQDPKDYLR